MDKNKLLKLIFGVIMIPIGFEIIGDFFMFNFGDLFDNLIGLSIIYFIYSILSGSSNKKKAVKKSKTSQPKNKETKLEKDAARKLRQHYKNSSFLFLDGGLVLKKRFESRDLFEATGVYLDDKYVATLAEFRDYDVATYEKILNLTLGKTFVPLKSVEPELVNPFVNNKEDKKPVNQANEFIERINEYNVEIENTEISNELYQTSSLLTMLSQLEDKGLTQNDKNVRKLYSHYMPIMLDILRDFCKMKDNRYEDIRTQEVKLTQNIELCNKAIKSILKTINDSDVMNMNVNMSTLESILKSDGMIDDLNTFEVKEEVKEGVR